MIEVRPYELVKGELPHCGLHGNTMGEIGRDYYDYKSEEDRVLVSVTFKCVFDGCPQSVRVIHKEVGEE